jgi:hypothetical protein
MTITTLITRLKREPTPSLKEYWRGNKIDVYLWNGAATFSDEKKRYEDFFSRHDVSVHGGGATEFVHIETNASSFLATPV